MAQLRMPITWNLFSDETLKVALSTVICGGRKRWHLAVGVMTTIWTITIGYSFNIFMSCSHACSVFISYSYLHFTTLVHSSTYIKVIFTTINQWTWTVGLYLLILTRQAITHKLRMSDFDGTRTKSLEEFSRITIIIWNVFFPSFDSLWFEICICNKKKSITSNKNKTLVCRRKNSNVSSRSEKNCATNREGPKIDWRAEIGHSHKFKRVMKSSTWKINISRRIYHKNAGPVLRKPAWFIVHFKNVSSQFHFFAIPPDWWKLVKQRTSKLTLYRLEPVNNKFVLNVRENSWKCTSLFFSFFLPFFVIYSLDRRDWPCILLASHVSSCHWVIICGRKGSLVRRVSVLRFLSLSHSQPYRWWIKSAKILWMCFCTQSYCTFSSKSSSNCGRCLMWKTSSTSQWFMLYYNRIIFFF